jgi:endonuclease/exonuclease/phosphatase family metal-dependent hydrolase
MLLRRGNEMSWRRPTTVFGLLLRALSLRRQIASWLVALVLFVIFQLLKCTCAPDAARFATFNIENYPKSTRQEEGALDLIRSMDVSAVALQEITDPERLLSAAKDRLGESWDVIATDRPHQKVALLVDKSVWTVRAARVLPYTEIYAGAKPTLDVELQSERTSVRMFVVHLKAGGDGGSTRAAQLRALAPHVAVAANTERAVVVAGDFNATGPSDLEAIQAFARETGLDHISRDVPCTSYWSRRDGCVGVALDHILSSRPDAGVEALGPCRDEGCEHRSSCPVYREEVSDHCPVAFEI